MRRTIAVICFVVTGFAAVAAVRAAEAPATQPTLREQMAQLRKLQDEVQAKLLAVPQEDQDRLAAFLKQPDTGLIKLLPREKYDRVLHVRGGGAYYSFVLRTHEYGHGSDIELQQDRLSCGFAGGDYGYFLALGDVPIERAAAADPAAPEAANGLAPAWVPEAAAARWPEFWGDAPLSREVLQERDQRERQDAMEKMQQALRDNPEKAMQQLREKQMLSAERVPATPGNTYLLRSVSPDRSDVLVAIRIERKFVEDGSILVSWKLLKRFPVVNRIDQLRGQFRPNRRPPAAVN
jgi:hypothetical protein